MNILGINKEKLIKNIMDQIKEIQIKLGYVKETVRLYYQVSSLNVLLEINMPDEQTMLAHLKSNFDSEDNRLGRLDFHIRDGKIEICVASEGVEYVHKEVPNPSFLMDIIELFKTNHNCSQEEICKIFAKYSKDYVCEKIPEGKEFDYMLYFKDSSIDEYYYCIKEEMGHTIYHRFTKEDYQLMNI